MKNLEKKIDLLVSFVMAEDDATRKRVKDALAAVMGETAPTPCATKSVKREVEDMLQEIGVPTALIGHDRLVSAVCLCIENPRALRQITSVLYPTVAAKEGNGATGSQVERAIRHAVEVCWVRADLDVLNKYFGNTVDINKCKPTNAEFISQLVKHIRRNREDQ